MEKYLDIQRNKLSSHVGEAEFIAADQLCHSLNESSGASPLVINKIRFFTLFPKNSSNPNHEIRQDLLYLLLSEKAGNEQRCTTGASNCQPSPRHVRHVNYVLNPGGISAWTECFHTRMLIKAQHCSPTGPNTMRMRLLGSVLRYDLLFFLILEENYPSK